MRLWSLHPKYLDTKGLIACWREGLLARKVLLGETRGYRNHPQLIRFRNSSDPIKSIDAYLSEILVEAESRGYRFNATKINPPGRIDKIAVTSGQIEYEIMHLKQKLASRDVKAYIRLKDVHEIAPNNIFVVYPGEIEKWEIHDSH